ncbi:MAG TPA: hypothetical protein VJH03_08025 [Blastocatellia bacterium]|nr:hypothetical protein [Blastocatellia bacterium]
MNQNRNRWRRLVAGSLVVLVLAGMLAGQARRPSSASRVAFRDSADTPPPDWRGPRFKLSHNYPKSQPTCEAPWLKRQVSFTSPNPRWQEWEGYVRDIVTYVKHGNEDISDGWNVKVDGQTRWYHVPWMAYDGQRGREFVHGLTNELSTALSKFIGLGRGTGRHTLPGAKSTGETDPQFETWSVGMYNPCGAWSVGQVFPPSGAPATYTESGRNYARGMPFPEGTVVIKLLNTTADQTAVPYLKNSTTWQANAHKQLSPTEYSTCEREVRDVHLIQVDLAVVDSRSPTRWVYSTLAYDGNMKGDSIWDRLRPLGVQWGNDPLSFPAVPQSQSRPLRETVLAPIDIFEHYGCQKRLAGTVDQSNSSCVSCHMGAYAAPPPYLNLQGQTIPAIFGFCGMCTEYNSSNAQYFSDYKYPATYPGKQFTSAIPLDSSLQLAVAFAQYAIYKNPHAVPTGCPDVRGSGASRNR